MINFCNWLLKFGTTEPVNPEIRVIKDKILKQHKKELSEIVKLNKKFKLIVEKGELEITITQINEVAKGK